LPTSLFFLSTASTPAISTLSLHDALPILDELESRDNQIFGADVLIAAVAILANVIRDLIGRRLNHSGRSLSQRHLFAGGLPINLDRKSTRLNSSHVKISYAVFCLKKKTMP